MSMDHLANQSTNNHAETASGPGSAPVTDFGSLFEAAESLKRARDAASSPSAENTTAHASPEMLRDLNTIPESIHISKRAKHDEPLSPSTNTTSFTNGAAASPRSPINRSPSPQKLQSVVSPLVQTSPQHTLTVAIPDTTAQASAPSSPKRSPAKRAESPNLKTFVTENPVSPIHSKSPSLAHAQIHISSPVRTDVSMAEAPAIISTSVLSTASNPVTVSTNNLVPFGTSASSETAAQSPQKTVASPIKTTLTPVEASVTNTSPNHNEIDEDNNDAFQSASHAADESMISLNESFILDHNVPGDLNKLQLKYCQTIVKNLRRLKDIPPFLKPVDPVALGIPTYFDVIKQPMDLSTIQKKLDEGTYPNYKSFEVDMTLMLNNCYTFNGPQAVVSTMATNIEKSFKKMLEKMPMELPSEKKKVAKLSDHARQNSVDSAVSRPKREIQPSSQSLSTMTNPYSQYNSGTNSQLQSPTKKKTKRVAHELKYCGQMLRELTNKKYLTFNFPFLVPVDPVALGIPHYTEIIKHPMDLSTMKRKLDGGIYFDYEDFEQDFRLMLTNCFTFNHPGDEVHEMGKKMERLFSDLWRGRPLAPPMPGSMGSMSSGIPSKKGKVHSASNSVSMMPDSDSSDDEEYNNQQIALLQQNLALMSSQLAMLMEKKRKKKEKRKSMSGQSHHHDLLATAPVGSGASASSKKQMGKKPKTAKVANAYDSLPEMSFEQKRELSERINCLPPEKVVDVFQIIREGMPSIGEKAHEEEIELDINSLDKRTIYRLYDFVKKHTSKSKQSAHAHHQSSSGSSSSDESD